MPRLLPVLFGVPLLLLVAVVLAPVLFPPAQSDGSVPHLSRADPVRMPLPFRDTPDSPHLRAYQAPVNREAVTTELFLPDEDGIGRAEAVATTRFPLTMPTPVMSFPGMALPPDMAISPPDTSGEMGRDLYVQAVNSRLQFFRRDGMSVLGPVALGTLWTELGLPCSASQGDPNVLYDQFAGRWLITQPVFNTQSTLGLCIALSDGEDPTGTYTLYHFPLEHDYVYDYPMFAVWHNGYYMTANRLTRHWANAGVAFVAFERDAMLAGESARAMTFSVTSTLKAVVADADGTTLPTTAPVFFAMRSTTALRVWRLFPNWTVPTDSNLIEVGDIPVAEHDYLCDGCVAQPDTTRLLGSHANGLAHEASYRKLGTEDAVILTHATNAAGAGNPDRVGVRWYEIRGIQSGQYRVSQQSTFAPDDGVGRWMAAAAQDRYGNLLLQYTVASAALYPGIRYTGRLASDPPSTLPHGEVVLATGSGSQTGTSRWGDYTTLALDPLDDCTFWFANQYVPETRLHSWATTIAAVRFADCVPALTPTPVPTLPPTATPLPATATVAASEVPTDTPTPSPTGTATATQVPIASMTPTAAAPSPTPIAVPPEPTPPELYRLYLPLLRH